MPSCITSPGFRNTGVGFTPMPTPGGVPVVMQVAGLQRHEAAAGSSPAVATPKIMVLVLPFC